MKFGINNPSFLQSAGNRIMSIPLFFRSLEDGNSFSVNSNNSSITNFVSNLSYQINGGDWIQLGIDPVVLNNNDVLCIKNTTGENRSNISTFNSFFTLSKMYEVGGDISATFYPSGDIPAQAFYRAFTAESNLINASSIVIGEPKESEQYSYMFENCTSLVSAPALPAEKLTSSCYSFMFKGCSSLTSIPELPATTLDRYCYTHMFEDCVGLVSAQNLPATVLSEHCYSYMFSGCTSLTSAPELPAKTIAISCYANMFKGCSSLTNAPELPVTSLADFCYSYMFSGCTSLTSAPELPATTLAKNCYQRMFENCTSLTSAPELPATTLISSCYSYMFSGCTSLTSAPELPAEKLTSGCYGNMFNGCSNLSSIVCLGATNGQTSYTASWVNGVAADGTFTKRSGVNWSTGTSGIPSGWTVVEQ